MKALPIRDTDDHTLASALWGRSSVDHMVPEFDDARIDGEVPLNVSSAGLPVHGIAFSNPLVGGAISPVRETDGVASYGNYVSTNVDARPDQIVFDSTSAGYPQIFAEMEENGITVSLSNIEMAKQTAHFAKLRAAMDVDDDYLLDLLCQGLSLPDQVEKEPVTLAVKRSLIGYSTRFATDAANLDESVTTGMSIIDIPIRMPRTDIGGCIVITVEAVPNQLYERREDPFLSSTDPDELPNAMRDFLDPQKVDMVKASRIDAAHTAPDSLFAYEPLNSRWNIDRVALGGKYYRPDPLSGFDENRQQIWASETVDPDFNEDFLLASDLHQEVFKVASSDYEPFECEAIGELRILGLTQMGKGLQEATEDYQDIINQVENCPP